MLMRHRTVLAALAALALVAACGGGEPATGPASGMDDGQAAAPAAAQDSAAGEPHRQLVPVQRQETETRSGRETVRQSTATIDWESARNDLAARGRSAEGVAFQIESGAAAPPVPVLLPSGQVRSAGADRPRYRALDDGYFAKYPGLDYDLVISGTNEWFSGGSRGTEAVASDAVFTRTITGAQVALNRYGAAYLLEFECREAEGRDPSACIDEDEALAVAEQLVITGTR